MFARGRGTIAGQTTPNTSGLPCIPANTTSECHNLSKAPVSAQFAGHLPSGSLCQGGWGTLVGSGRLSWGLLLSAPVDAVLCTLSLTAKLLNWQSADRWLLEKCISGSQGMWHFRAFVQGMAGGHGVLHSPFSASRGRDAQRDTSTELGAQVNTSGTGDTAMEDEPAAEPQMHNQRL